MRFVIEETALLLFVIVPGGKLTDGDRPRYHLLLLSHVYPPQLVIGTIDI